MDLNLNQLEAGPKEFSFQVPLTRLDGRATGGPMQAFARLELSQEQVVLKGSYQVHLLANCDRCGKPVELDQKGDFRLALVDSEQEEQLEEDVELSVSALDVDYYEGNEIHLNPYFEDQLILDIPMQLVCTPDCKGLCSQCGDDLNQGDCQCGNVNPNSPFAALKDMLKPKDA